VNFLEMDILFLVAVAIIIGFIGGRIVHKIKLPGVVGYLLAGLLLGPSFLNVFSPPLLDHLNVFFPGLALSMIAFMIGSEMKLSTLKEMGGGIGIITLLESFGAFVLVTAGVYLLTKKLYLSLVFGAMAPASAPAGTVAVLQEFKAKGRLTNALYAVVGLDDGLAILIFAVAIAIGKLLLTGGELSLGTVLEGPILEIAGAIVLGAILGLLTGYFTRKVTGEDGILAVSVGAILICGGLANYLHLSLILANLTLGMIYVNVFTVANKKAYRAIQSVSLPIYIIFFFMAGASLQIKLLPAMGVLGLVYLLCRMGGLIGGAFLGAVLSKQSRIIRNYLGLGILSQAGVAIGLSILAAGEFDTLGPDGRYLAVAVVNTIAATTIFFEIIGPIGTRIAISKAGEAGANITEQDLIETSTVADVMEPAAQAVSAGMSLSEVIRIVSETSASYYPVVDERNNLVGAVTLEDMRNTFATQELNDWLVALDIAEPITAKLTPDEGLAEALEKMRQLGVACLPVAAAKEDNRLAGVLDLNVVRRRLSARVLDRQRQAESIYAAAG